MPFVYNTTSGNIKNSDLTFQKCELRGENIQQIPKSESVALSCLNRPPQAFTHAWHSVLQVAPTSVKDLWSLKGLIANSLKLGDENVQ